MSYPELHVAKPWLGYIKSGIKTIEGRQMNLGKFRFFLQSDKVRFYNDEDEVCVKVVAVHWYATLYDYLDQEGWQNVVPGLSSYEAAVDEYHKFYSDKSIAQQGGMCGLKIKLLD